MLYLNPPILRSLPYLGKITRPLAFALCSFLLILASSLHATAKDRQGLASNIELSVVHDDNVFRTSEKTSDSIIVIKPEFNYLTNYGKHKFTGNYKGEFKKYSELDNLDNLEHKLQLSAKFSHSLKFSTDINLKYDATTEQPGSTNASTQQVEQFNETEQTSLEGKFYYGTKTSVGQVVFTMAQSAIRFTNNEQEYRDADVGKAFATFYYRLAPKTRFLVQTGFFDYNYVNIQPFYNQSSQQQMYLAGIAWQATAKTTGVFKVGYQVKDFDNPIYNDIEGLSYQLDTTWKPNSYTEVKLSAAQKTSESAQLDIGGFISTTYGINLKHKLSYKTAIHAGYDISNDDITYALDREDTFKNLTFGVSHKMLSWLEADVSYKSTERDSNESIYQFDANEISLSFRTVFE